MTEEPTHFKIKVTKVKVREEKNMKKILKTLIASLSVLLLSSCTFLSPKDWTNDEKYVIPGFATTMRFEKEMSSLSFENDGWAKNSFAKVDFSGNVIIYSTVGPGLTTKMEELWNTEGKAAVHDVLVNRWNESLFENGNGNKRNKGDISDFLNTLWFPVLINNTNREAQFFKKVVAQTTYENETWYACYLNNLSVTYYAQDGSEIFKYEQGFALGIRDAISFEQLYNQGN